MEFIEELDSKGKSQGCYKIFDFEDWDCFKGWYDQKNGTASLNAFNGEDWDWYNFEGITSKEMLLEKLSELEKANT